MECTYSLLTLDDEWDENDPEMDHSAEPEDEDEDDEDDEQSDW